MTSKNPGLSLGLGMLLTLFVHSGAGGSEPRESSQRVSARLVKAESAPSKPTSPAEVFETMRATFRQDKARGVHARYQFSFSGPAGGDWWIIVKDGAYQMGRGKIENPGVVFAATDKDWVDICNGTLGGVRAFITGRLKISGDKGLARKLDEIFP